MQYLKNNSGAHHYILGVILVVLSILVMWGINKWEKGENTPNYIISPAAPTAYTVLQDFKKVSGTVDMLPEDKAVVKFMTEEIEKILCKYAVSAPQAAPENYYGEGK